MGWGCQPHARPPTWRTRVSLFVGSPPLTSLGWETLTVATLLTTSCQDNSAMQAPPLCQSMDTLGETFHIIYIYIWETYAKKAIWVPDLERNVLMLTLMSCQSRICGKMKVKTTLDGRPCLLANG